MADFRGGLQILPGVFPSGTPTIKCSAQCWLGDGNGQLPLLHSTETYLLCETKALVFRWKSNTHRSLTRLAAIHYGWAWREEQKTLYPWGKGRNSAKCSSRVQEGQDHL